MAATTGSSLAKGSRLRQTQATQAACTGRQTRYRPDGHQDRPTEDQVRRYVKKKQLEQWIEHYLELYSVQKIMTYAALDTTSQLPVLDKVDKERTVEELSKAIDCLATGKAPSEDSIPLDVIKAGKEELIEALHELLCLCWREGSIPRDMHRAKIVTLY